MMYFISKLYIKNNLLNTTKYKNECFFFFLSSNIEYENEK